MRIFPVYLETTRFSIFSPKIAYLLEGVGVGSLLLAMATLLEHLGPDHVQVNCS